MKTFRQLSLACLLAAGVSLQQGSGAEKGPLIDIVASEEIQSSGHIGVSLVLVNNTSLGITAARVEIDPGTPGFPVILQVSKFAEAVDTTARRIQLPNPNVNLNRGQKYNIRVAWVRFSDGSELNYK